MDLLMPLEGQLGRPLSPTLYTPKDLRAKRAAGNGFIERVLQQSKINIMGHNPLESMDGR